MLVARFGTVIPSFADYRHTSKEILLNYRHVKTNGRVRIHRTIDVYHGGGDQDCGLVFIFWTISDVLLVTCMKWRLGEWNPWT